VRPFTPRPKRSALWLEHGAVGGNDGGETVLVIGGAAEPKPPGSPACGWTVAGRAASPAQFRIDPHEIIIAVELQAEP
jgi:hypothetical protein